MRTSVPGNSNARRCGPAARLRVAGFTLLELMVVMSIIAIAAGSITLALRDPAAAQLDREAERLAALLESARAQARASGLAVQWVPQARDAPATAGSRRTDFRFVGLPPAADLPQHWLTPEIAARIDTRGGRAAVVWLGPEPMIPAQRITLSLGERRVAVATDGLHPFSVGTSP